MKIGYPCLNLSIGCTSSKTFRLRSYSDDRLKDTVEQNLHCLIDTLLYNVKRRILFFRITSDLVPFASHPACTFDWRRHFEQALLNIGKYIRRNNVRISMHPDQFTLLNSPDLNIFKRSVTELEYHADVLDMMGMDETAKIQIHVGGVYNDKNMSMRRFIDRFEILPACVQRRLVIENDERLYSLKDCLGISYYTAIPVLLDVFHHQLNNNGEELHTAFDQAARTWKEKDGLPMVDYSSQQKRSRVGTHAETIDINQFKKFIKETELYDFDIMLEIKDKENSAIRAVKELEKDPRIVSASS